MCTDRPASRPKVGAQDHASNPKRFGLSHINEILAEHVQSLTRATESVALLLLKLVFLEDPSDRSKQFGDRIRGLCSIGAHRIGIHRIRACEVHQTMVGLSILFQLSFSLLQTDPITSDSFEVRVVTIRGGT